MLPTAPSTSVPTICTTASNCCPSPGMMVICRVGLIPDIPTAMFIFMSGKRNESALRPTVLVISSFLIVMILEALSAPAGMAASSTNAITRASIFFILSASGAAQKPGAH